MFLQKTLRGKAVISGIGLHSGIETTLSFCPAPANTGIHLVRTDLEGCPSVPVHAKNVKATSLATSLGCDRFVVSTVEHCLSTLAAFRIDNVYLELKGSEIPIGDGSAKVFLDEIRKVGTIEQNEPRKYIYITKPIYCGTEEKHAYVVPYNGLRLSCTIDFPHRMIGQQFIDVDINEQSFAKELAPARTFGFLKDVEKMREMGLSMGGSLDNAIVLDDNKILNEGGLRFENEFVRHKALDALGDLVTLGRPLMGHVVLYKAGHDLLNQLVQKILASPDCHSELELAAGLPQLEEFEVPFSGRA
ncbi:MAG: UDP-3-O-acyl-N-acetylglucosamine deacetylase [Bdellovibrionales bacterium]|nr:UDP-3-O-acyl-N-acetylglucosamine deacetylase [Bdellovibrionales bacterium]